MWDWGAVARRRGLVWQEAPQTTGECQCCLAICPPPPGSRPPSAHHRRARGGLQCEGAEPGREGRQRPFLPLFIPIFFPAPPIGPCARCVKSLLYSLQVRLWHAAGRERWMCAGLPFLPPSVCLPNRGPSPLQSPSCPWLLSPFFLALICKSTVSGGQVSGNLGSFAHHPPPAS